MTASRHPYDPNRPTPDGHKALSLSYHEDVVLNHLLHVLPMDERRRLHELYPVSYDAVVRGQR